MIVMKSQFFVAGLFATVFSIVPCKARVFSVASKGDSGTALEEPRDEMDDVAPKAE